MITESFANGRSLILRTGDGRRSPCRSWSHPSAIQQKLPHPQPTCMHILPRHYTDHLLIVITMHHSTVITIDHSYHLVLLFHRSVTAPLKSLDTSLALYKWDYYYFFCIIIIINERCPDCNRSRLNGVSKRARTNDGSTICKL